MNNEQIRESMYSCAMGYSKLIYKSISVAIAIDMDTATLKKIINEWIQIRRTIILELTIAKVDG